MVRVKKHTYYTEHPENKRWVKRINRTGRRSIIKWSRRQPCTIRRSLVRLMLKHQYTMDEIRSMWIEAIVWAHLQPNKRREPLSSMIPWKFDHLVRSELKIKIDRESNEVLWDDFSSVGSN